jgi:hypothetical protein
MPETRSLDYSLSEDMGFRNRKNNTGETMNQLLEFCQTQLRCNFSSTVKVSLPTHALVQNRNIPWRLIHKLVAKYNRLAEPFGQPSVEPRIDRTVL